MNYQFLEWDSDFFGFRTAKVTTPSLGTDALEACLSELRRQDARLVYWAADQKLAEDDAARLGAFLADRKLTFEIDLCAASLQSRATFPDVSTRPRDLPIEILHSLAIQSGTFSRFTVDPNIAESQSQRLYRTWMDRSLNGELAASVQVARAGETVAGMVTLTGNDKYAAIGLIAVVPGFRRKKYGEQLVNSALAWATDGGHTHARVVTQQRNIAACALFRKCGYRVRSLQYFYHFWL